MDKYEFNIKVEQIKKMVTRGDFETSMKIADTIDWRRVRSANLLSMISQVYEKNGEYQEAKEVLLLAYERAPIGKRLLFKLTELALKEGSIREAEDYYREFCDLAQDDPRQYLLRYMILKEKKVPNEQLIGCLEHYVSQELDERWMYELASLYERAGQQHKCVQMCDRIMLMFAFGKYVDKAMDLKVRYAPLSEYQLDLMKNKQKYEAKLKVVEQKFDEETLGGYDDEESSYSPYSTESYERNGYVQEQYTQGDYPQGQYAQNQYAQGGYGPENYVQNQYAQREYEPENYGQNQYIQGEYVQENYGQNPYAQGEYVQENYGQNPYAQGEYVQGEYGQEGYPQDSYVQGGYVQKNDVQGQYDQEVYSQGQYVPERYPKVAYPQEQYPQEEHYQGQRQYFENESNGFSYDYDQENVQPVTAEPVHTSIEEETDSIDEELVVHFHQEDMEQKLAKEMSGISEDISVEQEPASMQTKVPQAGQYNAFREPETASEVPASSYLLIEAKTPEKGLETAVKVLKQIHMENGSSNQVAKITGSKLNQKGIWNIVDKLAGKDLVVEEAGDLSKEQLIGLQQLMSEDTDGMNVILIDNPRQLEGLYQQNPELTTVFECISSDQIELSDEEKVTEKAEVNAQAESEELPPAQKDLEGPESAGEEPVQTEAEPEQEKEIGTEPDVQFEAEEDSEAEYDSEPEFQEEPEFEPDPEPDVKSEYGSEPEFQEEADSEEEYDSEAEPDPEDDEEMDIDDFADYATKYASKIDCSITGKSMLALYERIEIMEEDGIPLTKANAEEMIEEAADRAEKPPLGKLIKGMFSSKYDKEGLLILREEHFI